MVSAATMAFTMASSVACTVAAKSPFMDSLGSMERVRGPFFSSAAPGLAVEKATKMSPEPLPAMLPLRARPRAARRASRLV